MATLYPRMNTRPRKSRKLFPVRSGRDGFDPHHGKTSCPCRAPAPPTPSAPPSRTRRLSATATEPRTVAFNHRVNDPRSATLTSEISLRSRRMQLTDEAPAADGGDDTDRHAVLTRRELLLGGLACAVCTASAYAAPR